MKSTHLRVLLVVAVCAVLLSGCKSSKSSVVRAGAGHSTSSTVKKDYSRELAGPMGQDLVDEARTWLGTPYRYGGKDRRGTDCSGMVMEVYRSVCAVKIPRSTREQKSYCTEVARNKTRIGDLVFFGSGGGVSHVGLYIGKGEMIHASSSRGVMVSNIDSGYWGDRYLGAGRVAGAEESWAANGNGRKKHRKDKNRTVPESVPPVMEVPTVDRPLGVPTITLEELASMNGGNAAAGGDAAMASAGKPVTAQSVPQKPVATESQKAIPPEPVEAIDLLDMIINEKVDSIFSNRFMD